MTTRELMISNVRAYNKVLPIAHLKKMSDKELMNNCHWNDRLTFQRMLNKEQIGEKQKTE